MPASGLIKNENAVPKKTALFQSRTASREASREAARLLERAVIKNDQERIYDKEIVVLKRSRYFFSLVTSRGASRVAANF